LNRDQKVAAIAEIADEIRGAETIFAVDFRGISVTQAADVRTRLREADASFRIVKNTLTERAADAAGVEGLKPLLSGPTALTFVRGDAATAAKAISTFNRETQLLLFKGGVMNGEALDGDQIMAISRLPARDVLYGQLVGVVASPITGLVRGLNALLSGVAIALGAVRDMKESGELPAGEPPAGMVAATPAAEAPAAEAPVAEASVAESTEVASDDAFDPDGGAPSEPDSSEAPPEGDDDDSTSTETNDQADASA